MCWRDVVDTRTNRYVRDLATGPGDTRTVRLQLSDATWRDLAQWVDDSRFFDWPVSMRASEFKVYDSGTVLMTTPSPRYVLEIQRGGRRHRVEFADDNHEAETELLTRVRRLVGQLERAFTQLPEVEKLPKPAALCR